MHANRVVFAIAMVHVVEVVFVGIMEHAISMVYAADIGTRQIIGLHRIIGTCGLRDHFDTCSR